MGRPEDAVDHGREPGEQAIKDNLEVVIGSSPNTNTPEKPNTTPGSTEPDEKPEEMQEDPKKKTA
jgi:hypothetical protein